MVSDASAAQGFPFSCYHSGYMSWLATLGISLVVAFNAFEGGITGLIHGSNIAPPRTAPTAQTSSNNTVAVPKPSTEANTPTGSASITSQQLPDRVVITKTQPRTSSVIIEISDSAEAQSLYSEIVDLPVLHSHCDNSSGCTAVCPVDTDVDYQLSFFSGDSTVLGADFHPVGCSYLRLSDGSEKDWNAQFDSELEKLFGYSSELQLSGFDN